MRSHHIKTILNVLKHVLTYVRVQHKIKGYFLENYLLIELHKFIFTYIFHAICFFQIHPRLDAVSICKILLLQSLLRRQWIYSVPLQEHKWCYYINERDVAYAWSIEISDIIMRKKKYVVLTNSIIEI